MNNFLKLNNIDRNNAYVIGDVHGCYFTLMDLIKKLPKNAELIFTGDLVDKGKYVKNVVEFVKSNNYYCVLGNHEEFFLKYIYDSLNNDLRNIWNTNEVYGGNETVNSYKDDSQSLTEHYQWIKELPIFIEIDNDLIISHGFSLPYYDRRFDKKFRQAILNNRIESKHKKEWEDFSENKVINIFGHDDNKEVVKEKNYFGIDTGAVYKNKLTAIKLSDFSITEVTINNDDY